MIAGLLQLAAFLGVAWLLSLGVDHCYRLVGAPEPDLHPPGE